MSQKYLGSAICGEVPDPWNRKIFCHQQTVTNKFKVSFNSQATILSLAIPYLPGSISFPKTSAWERNYSLTLHSIYAPLFHRKGVWRFLTAYS